MLFWMLHQVNCRIPSLCAQLLDSHLVFCWCHVSLILHIPWSLHGCLFHLRYQSLPLVFPNCFLGIPNLVVPVRDPSGSSDSLWIHHVRASSPSFGQIAEPVCLLWLLQHSKPHTDTFSFFSPNGALQLKFVVSPWPTDPACFLHVLTSCLPKSTLSAAFEVHTGRWLQRGRVAGEACAAWGIPIGWLGESTGWFSSSLCLAFLMKSAMQLVRSTSV